METLSVRQAAAYLQYSVQHMYRLIDKFQIPTEVRRHDGSTMKTLRTVDIPAHLLPQNGKEDHNDA